MAYARDPSALLAGGPFPPPMNAAGPLHTGDQPVTYERVALASGRRYAAVQVDWRRGVALLFETAEDAIQNVAADELTGILAPCPLRPMREYADEALRFLERGHSLLHPRCACRHGLSPGRCRELGIAAERAGGCALPSGPREVTAEELALELALDDPGPLMQALEGRCSVRVDGGVRRLGPLDAAFGPIRWCAAGARRRGADPGSAGPATTCCGGSRAAGSRWRSTSTAATTRGSCTTCATWRARARRASCGTNPARSWCTTWTQRCACPSTTTSGRCGTRTRTASGGAPSARAPGT